MPDMYSPVFRAGPMILVALKSMLLWPQSAPTVWPREGCGTKGLQSVFISPWLWNLGLRSRMIQVRGEILLL